MIRHIVLLGFKEGTSEGEIQSIMDDLDQLRGEIPGITHFSWGPSNSVEGLEQGLLHGFVMDFKDAETRQTYLEHPEHIKIATERVIPALAKGTDSLVVFDYEFAGG